MVASEDVAVVAAESVEEVVAVVAGAVPVEDVTGAVPELVTMVEVPSRSVEALVVAALVEASVEDVVVAAALVEASVEDDVVSVTGLPIVDPALLTVTTTGTIVTDVDGDVVSALVVVSELVVESEVVVDESVDVEDVKVVEELIAAAVPVLSPKNLFIKLAKPLSSFSALLFG